MSDGGIGGSLYARAILVDTGAQLAHARRSDQNHLLAVACFNEIAAKRLPLFVSLPTIYESHRRFLFDLGQQAGVRMLQSLRDGRINVIRTIDDDEITAERLIMRYAAFRLTLTDANNMAVMARLGIAAAFSFDSHYLLAGFIRVPPLHV